MIFIWPKISWGKGGRAPSRSPNRKPRLKLLVPFILFVASGPADAKCPLDWAAARQTAVATTPKADCTFENHACRWSFDLGVPQSRQVFETLRADLAQCPDLIDATRDDGVNHPDFYDAWAFRFPGMALSLSIKDKSALESTFVVLRALP